MSWAISRVGSIRSVFNAWILTDSPCPLAERVTDRRDRDRMLRSQQPIATYVDDDVALAVGDCMEGRLEKSGTNAILGLAGERTIRGVVVGDFHMPHISDRQICPRIAEGSLKVDVGLD